MQKQKVSLRARNLNGDKFKVNDRRGIPIEIAEAAVWRVVDTAQVSFDVDDYEHYAAVQSEFAVRYLASSYAYDQGEVDGLTLCSGTLAVNRALQEELHERLRKPVLKVEEARLTHLAFAPEIAKVMLRRQQAEAIVDAPSKMVQGVVGMVVLAIEELESEEVVELDGGVQGHDGKQSPRSALWRIGGTYRREYWNALHLGSFQFTYPLVSHASFGN